MFELILKLLGLVPKLTTNPAGGLGSSETKKDAKKLNSIVNSKKENEMSLKVKNQEKERLEGELKKLPSKNKELDKILKELVQYVNDEFKKDVVITMIYRIQTEQDYLYRNSAKYKKKKFKSPHQFWHAIDLRSWIYTKKQRTKMVGFLNKRGKELGNYYSWTAKVHEVGTNGLHFHVQFAKS